MLIEYNKKVILEKPDWFDEYIISSLKSIFKESLYRIFRNLSEEIDSNILNIYKSRIERQIFPALVLSKSLKDDSLVYEDYCCNFIKGYTIPLLIQDHLLDSRNGIQQKDISESFKLIYNAQYHMLALPNSFNLLKRINHFQMLETQATFTEFINRFRLPDNIDELKDRVTCYLFPSIVSGCLDMYGITISETIENMLHLFSKMRQISDAITDVEEDLKAGNVTLPILYLFDIKDIRNQIKEFWQGRKLWEDIEIMLLENNVYDKCYNNFIGTYSQAIDVKNNNTKNYPFLNDLFIFYDLKLCLLIREKNNGWKDNKKFY